MPRTYGGAVLYRVARYLKQGYESGLVNISLNKGKELDGKGT